MLLTTYLKIQRQRGSAPLTEEEVQELLAVGAYAYRMKHDIGTGSTLTIRRDTSAVSDMVLLEYDASGTMISHYGDIDGAHSGEPREADFIAMGAEKIR